MNGYFCDQGKKQEEMLERPPERVRVRLFSAGVNHHLRHAKKARQGRIPGEKSPPGKQR
jgi:hypothetical protein